MMRSPIQIFWNFQMNLEEIEKGGYDHFMLKEIYEQPRAIKDTYRGRLLADQGIDKNGRNRSRILKNS